ncbi:MAG: protein kinase [Prosthecobacter sp.]
MTSSSSASNPSTSWQPPSLDEMRAMLPQYEFISLLGRGGTGAVYKATQISLDRAVAIKVLPVDLFANDDAQFAERFKNEARTMAKMNHPSIVKVFDFGETSTGLLYIVMEFIDGTDVAQIIAAQGKLPEDHALSITAHVSDALAYAHGHGIVHRDIKPANILINMEGAVKVADFGLAKANDPSQSGITKTNLAMGTPDFVAPEAFIPGVPLDGRADLYAMGVMLYQMLTGEIPRGIWTMPSAKLGTDPRFDAIIAKAMQTDREHRYQTATDLRQDLDTILTLPRAVLVAQQQAAAEAAARATQAQKRAASGPQRRPVSAPSPQAPPPVRKKSGLAPLVGVAMFLALVVGVFQVRKKPVEDEQTYETPPTVATAEPRPEPSRPPVTTPAPVPAPDSPPMPPSAAVAPSPAGPPSGPGTNLLALIDLERDAKSGDWSIVNGELVSNTNKEDSAIRLPTPDIPEEYDLRYRLTRVSGFAVQFRFPKGKLEGVFHTDGWTGNRSNLNETTIGFSHDKAGSVKRSKLLLRDGKSHELLIQVRSDRLTALLDGVEVVTSTTLLSAKTVGGSEPELGLRISRGKITFHAIAMIPVNATSPAPGPAAPSVASTPGSTASPTVSASWTDLLATADVARDTVQGRWEMRAEGLHCEAGGGMEHFKFNHTPEEEYDYEIDFTVLRGGTVSQMLVVPGHQFALRIASDGSFCCLGALLDGKGWQDPGRNEAIARDTGIRDGIRTRCKVEIRRGAARVLINDKEVINWRGDFKRLELHTRSYNRNHKTELGVTCQNAEVVFHRVTVPPPRLNEKLAAELIASDSRIARLDSGFKARYESDAEKPYLAAVAALNKSYITNGIAKARTAAQNRGSLKEVVALDEVKARIERGEGVPEVDEPDAPESLKSLRAIYRTALEKITAERDAKAAPIYDIYLKALDDYIAELEQAGKNSEIEKVVAFRDDVARQKPDSEKTTTPTIAVQAPDQPAPTASSAAASSGGSSWRRAAEWIVAGRGSAIVLKGGQRIEIKTLEDIPSGRFDFDELTIRGTGSNPKLKDADTEALNGLRDLRRVLVRAEGLTDAGFAFLANNADLEFLAIEISSEVTDGVLAHLVSTGKLSEIRIQGAWKFTGRGLERTPFLDSLQAIAFNNSGFSDEGLRSLGGARQINRLDLSGTLVTGTGCAVLGDMKSLRQLILQDTAFDDEGAAVVAKLSGLRILNIQNSKITEAGLHKLSFLKNLTEVVVRNGNPQLSEAALVEFQKSMPSCKVH